MYLQVNDRISTMALHRVELEVPLEVLGIKSRNGQPITKSSLWTKGRYYYKEAVLFFL